MTSYLFSTVWVLNHTNHIFSESLDKDTEKDKYKDKDRDTDKDNYIVLQRLNVCYIFGKQGFKYDIDMASCDDKDKANTKTKRRTSYAIFLKCRGSVIFTKKSFPKVQNYSCCIKGWSFDSPIILISLSHYWLVLFKLFVLTTDACPIALQWMSGLADFTEMLKSNVYRLNASGWEEMASYSTNTVCGNWISNVWQRDEAVCIVIFG